MAAQAVDIRQLVDERRVNAFNIILLLASVVIMICDGYDLYVGGYVAPELGKAWHLAPAELTPFLTASVAGLLFGGPLLGYFGDRFGRKKGILLASAIYGSATVAAALGNSLHELTVLRFVAGVGIGGVFPNIIALNSEFTPKRVRAAFIISTQFGMPIGQALGAVVSGLLVPTHGWRVLFWAGGIVPLVVALLAVFVLPESIKYLALHPGRREEARKIVERLQPGTRLPGDAVFAIPDNSDRTGLSPAALFSGGRAGMTALLWMVQIANQVGNFFMISWLPLLLRSMGAGTGRTSVGTTMFSLGGIVGGILLASIVDRYGIAPIAAMFALGVPVVIGLGTPGFPTNALTAGAGFCVVGINFGMSAVMGMLYPTPIRANGVGWAMAMGRIGAIGGSLLGGILFAMNLSLRQLFFGPAIALSVGAVLCALFAQLCFRRFGSLRLEEKAAEQPAGVFAT